MDALVKARSNMLATLDLFCGTLEDGVGVTDPVSGPVVLALYDAQEKPRWRR
jgi:hypothetical protein